MINVILPSIHLNGTSKEMLLGEVLDARRAINAAMSQLRDMNPHPRDYYVREFKDPGVTKRAQEQHYARIAKLQEVLDELTALAEGIDQGGYKTPEYQDLTEVWKEA